MKSKSAFSWNAASLCALFLLGDTLIDIPLPNADDKTVISFALSMVVTALLLGAFFCLARLLYRCKQEAKPYGKPIAVIIGFLILCIAGESFARFSVFANDAILPNVSPAAIALVTAATVIYAAHTRQNVLLKFGLLAFLASAATVIYFFLASIPYYKAENLMIYSVPEWRQIGREIVPYITRLSLPACVLPFFTVFCLEKRDVKEVFSGVGVGYGLSLLIIFNSILIFSPWLAAEFAYPYSAAISTLSAGHLFSRMDGFSYFLGLICTIVRLSICIKTVGAILRPLDR